MWFHRGIVDGRPLERVCALRDVEMARLVVLVDSHLVRDHLDVAAAREVARHCPAVVVVHALARQRVDDRLDRVAVDAQRRPPAEPQRHQPPCQLVLARRRTRPGTPGPRRNGRQRRRGRKVGEEVIV